MKDETSFILFAFVRELLGCMIPVIIFAGFILLVCGIVFATWKYGSVPAYIGSCWLIPATTIMWLCVGEGALGFGESVLNAPFLMTVVATSFILFVICFPLILLLKRKRLSAVEVIGLLMTAPLHGSAFLIYILIYGGVMLFGK